MQRDEADAPDAAPFTPATPRAGAADVADLRALLEAAERPLVIAGGVALEPGAADALRDYAEASQLPVVLLVPPPGPPRQRLARLRRRPRPRRRAAPHRGAEDAATWSWCWAAAFGEVPSRRLPPPDRAAALRLPARARAREPDELNLVYEADLAIVASAPAVVAGLAALGPLPASASRANLRTARRRTSAWTTPRHARSTASTWRGRRAPARRAPPDAAVITNGAGNYTVWVHRYHRHRRYGVQLAPTSGAMGYGIPGGDRRQGRAPRPAGVAFAGDGCFMMACQELATAVSSICRSSWCSPTTACSARSGCTRSATSRAASRHRRSEPRLRGAGAVVRLPRRAGRPTTPAFRRRWRARSTPGRRRCIHLSATPRRSRLQRRSTRSEATLDTTSGPTYFDLHTKGGERWVSR